MTEPKYKVPSFRTVEKKSYDDSNDGWCIICGKWTHHSCEPDAEKYECPKCKNKSVYGTLELGIRGWFK